MGRFNKAQNSFQAGEISPKLEARFDLDQYAQGAARLENLLVQPQGGVIKRPGFRFIRDLTGDFFFNDRLGTLHPFIFSKTERNIIALRPNLPAVGTSSVRVYKMDGTPATVTGGDDFGLLANDDKYGFHIAQTGDVVIVVHNSGKLQPRIITRTALDTFDVTRWDTFNDLRIPFRDINATPTTLQAAAGSGVGDTITASDPVFDAGHVGSLWRVDDIGGGKSGYFRITGFTSTTQVTATWIVNLGSMAAFDTWYEPSWSDYRGWPKSVCFYETRLIFGGNTAEPSKVWGARVNNIFQFMEPKFLQDVASDTTGFRYTGDPQETDPFSYVPASQETNIIHWLTASRRLNIGTFGAEFTMRGTNDKILSNVAVQLNTESREGSSAIQPERAGNSVLYVGRNGKTIREFVYSVDAEGYVSRDLSILSDEIIYHNFDSAGDYAGLELAELSYQNSRSILWVLNRRNSLVGLTLERETGTRAWHRHTIGGPSPKVISIVTLPSDDGTFDDLWALIERPIDTTGGPPLDKFYLEKMGDDFNHSLLYNNSTQEDDKPYLMDSSKRVVLGGPGKTFAGFDHLIGETVKVIRDGFVHPDVVVNGSGEVVVSKDSTEVIAGLEYKPTFRSLRLEAGGDLGASQGERKCITELLLRFHKTYGAKFGRDESNLETINFKEADAGMGDPLQLLSGDKKVDFSSEPDDDARILITQDEPLPFNLLGIVVKGQTYVS